MSAEPKFNYGGQAVMEGVMMRGAHIAAIAVRDPQGNIVIHEEALNTALYRGRISKIPFVRGLVGLWDALVLGTRALIWSAEVALQEEEDNKQQPTDATSENGTPNGFVTGTPEEVTASEDATPAFSDGAVAGMVLISLTLGLGLFFALPAASSSWIGNLFGIKSRLAVDAIEGGVKLAIFIGYIALIGLMEDVKRLFGYHGAEHKTINAYEAGAELTPEEVQKHSIEHPRCGTAFLLNVIVLSIIVHTITGRPSNIFALMLSRIAVIPIIAGVAYEIIRFTAKNADNPIIKAIIVPNLALQRLTTRKPDDSMVEVGIAALERVLAAEAAAARGEAIQPQDEIIVVPLPATEGAD